MRRNLAAIVIGALLAALVTGLLGSLGPSGSVHLSRSPVADYLALAGATGLSAIPVYGITASCMTLCLFVAGLCRRRPVPAPRPDPEPMQLEEAQPWPS